MKIRAHVAGTKVHDSDLYPLRMEICAVGPRQNVTGSGE